MKKITNFKLGLLLSAALGTASVCAVNSLGTVLTTNAQDAVYDTVNGNFYVGTAVGAGNSAIAKFTRYVTDGTALSMTDVGNGVGVVDLGVTNMAISVPSTGARIAFQPSTLPQRITVIQDAAGTITTGQMANEVQSGAGADGDIRGNIAMSDNIVFAAVATAAATWLDNANSLIAAHVINGTTMVPAAAASTVALALADFSIGTPIIDAAASEDPVLHWDQHLERLYVGNTVEGIAGAGEGATSVFVMSVTSLTTGAGLAIQALKTNPTAAWATGAAAATRNIVGYGGLAAGGYSAVTSATGIRLNVHHLTTLLTDHGHSYLIVVGGQTTTGANSASSVWALPLVSKGYTNQGSLADVNSANFSVRADDGKVDLYNQGSTPAIVGGGVLPCLVGSTVRTFTVGNTVYAVVNAVSDGGAGDTIEGGLFYSQPCFDHDGKISQWSRWEKAAPNALGTSATDGNLLRAAVDPVTGKVWGVPGGALTQVRSTAWTKSTTASELATAVNAQLGTDGCYSILSIGRSTQNFGDQALLSLAVFGGKGKVVFARTAVKTAGYAGIQTGQALASYAAGAGFLTTTLPDTTLNVNCLEYSRGLTGAVDKSYFFAGTDKGLYIMTAAADVAGDPALRLDNLNALYFADAPVWKELAYTGGAADTTTKVVGSVRKILAVGDDEAAAVPTTQRVFVLARDIDSAATITDRLYIVELAGTSAACAIREVAVSGVTGTNSNLGNATRFHDFELIAGGSTNGEGDQIVLITDNGLYQSRAAGVKGAITTTCTTTELMLWAEVGNKPDNTHTNDISFVRSYAPRTFGLAGTFHSPSSFYTIRYKDDANFLQTYSKQALDVWGANGLTIDGGAATDATGNFIKRVISDNTTSETNFLRLDRIKRFWTDGGRRLAVTKPSDGTDTESLYALPYRVGSTYPQYNLTEATIAKLNTGALSSVKRFYAIDLLPNGMLAVGTDQGLIVLE